MIEFGEDDLTNTPGFWTILPVLQKLVSSPCISSVNHVLNLSIQSFHLIWQSHLAVENRNGMGSIRRREYLGRQRDGATSALGRL